MFIEKNYKYLSEHAYWLDRGQEDYEPSLIKGKVIKDKDFHYKIIKIEDNTSNGTQAMAVAPIINGK